MPFLHILPATSALLLGKAMCRKAVVTCNISEEESLKMEAD